MVLGALASIASVAPYILAIVAPFLPVFVWLRTHYLTTSREIKRLDAVSRSPIYAFFASTLTGLSTIRAFRVTSDFALSFASKVDHNTAAVFTFYTTTRWFGVRLDFGCTLMVLATGLLMVGLRDSVSAAEAGFALTYSLLLTSLFQWGVRQSAEVENQMTAAERIMQYGALPAEGCFYPPTMKGVKVSPAEPMAPSQSLVEPEAGWPREGRLQFIEYCMRYREGLPLVLKGLTFDVQPREKIGVCGTTGAGQQSCHTKRPSPDARTGRSGRLWLTGWCALLWLCVGKSSLFAAIFRLVEGASGSIVIDGVETSRLPLHTLRSAIAIIPQSPVIFSNTLRYNLGRTQPPPTPHPT
jgi:ABC-type multidrug transport system fused ATPase/permease subunit